MRVALPGCAVLTLLLLSSPSLPDTFLLKNGQSADGYEVSRSAKGEILLGTSSGTRRIAASTLAGVTPSADPAADFERYWKGLGKKDAPAAAALGAWAKERGIPGPAERAFRRAMELAPDNEGARAGLGFVRYEGEWLTAADAAKARSLESLRADLAARHGKAAGGKAECALTDHWALVDLVGDGKAKERATRLEEAFAAAAEVLGSPPWERRALAVACSGTDQYVAWIDAEGKSLPGMRGPLLEYAKKATGLKWNEPPTLVRNDSAGSGAMLGAFIHTAGHLLVNNWGTLNREQPFWVEEGFGGWMEQKVLGARTSHCWAVSPAEGYGTLSRGSKQWEVDLPDWKELVKKAAAAGEFLPLDQLDSLPQGQYSNREVGQAFSFVAFLVEKKEHARLRDYLERVKGGGKSPVAFRQAYGVTFEQIEGEWKEFVRSGW